MLAIAAMEAIGMLFGMALSNLVDSMLPDVDVPDVDIDGPEFDAPDVSAPGDVTGAHRTVDPGALLVVRRPRAGPGSAGRLPDRLRRGRLCHPGAGPEFDRRISACPDRRGARPDAGLPGNRFIGLGLAKIMPKEETEAVSSEEFVGRVAVIIRGEPSVACRRKPNYRTSMGRPITCCWSRIWTMRF